MNKDKALERLTALEAEAKELRKIIEAPEKKSKEERFWELILQTNSIKIDKEKYPDSTFGFVGEKFLWEYDSKNCYLWISYPLIWSVFEKEYNLNYNDIQSFIKFEVEEHFKCKGVTPTDGQLEIDNKVEEHFKCKGVTPTRVPFWSTGEVEEHFKCKGVTPHTPGPLEVWW